MNKYKATWTDWHRIHFRQDTWKVGKFLKHHLESEFLFYFSWWLEKYSPSFWVFLHNGNAPPKSRSVGGKATISSLFRFHNAIYNLQTEIIYIDIFTHDHELSTTNLYFWMTICLEMAHVKSWKVIIQKSWHSKKILNLQAIILGRIPIHEYFSFHLFPVSEKNCSMTLMLEWVDRPAQNTAYLKDHSSHYLDFLTQLIMRSAFKYNSVSGKEQSSFSREDMRTSKQSSCGFLSAIRIQ